MGKKYYFFILVLVFAINTSTGFAIDPTITGTNPHLNAINVNKSSSIEIIFSTDMDPATVNSSNIKVYGSNSGYKQCSVSYDVPQRKSIINPQNDFFNGEEVFVTLTRKVVSNGGDSLSPFTYRFNIAAILGPGTFTEIPITNQSGISGSATGDFDRDGDIDLLILNYESRSLDLYTNNGTASFTHTASSSIADSTGGPIIACDLDGDGDFDAVVFHYSFLPFYYAVTYYNNGSGIFNQGDSSEFYYRTNINGVIRNSDKDNDGDMDLFYAAVTYGSGGSNGSDILMLSNDGSGHLAHEASISFPTLCPHVQWPYQFTSGGTDLMDYNNDGYSDMIFSLSDFYYPGLNCYEIWLLVNNNGGFTGNIITDPGALKFFSSGNFDNDLDLDFACDSSYFENNGSGSFVYSPNTLTSNTKIVNDFDGDGDLDILGSYCLYKNSGNGSFTPFGSFTTPVEVENVCAGDFDNDGDIDVISGGKTLYLNQNPQPAITSMFPMQNAINVSRATNIEITFSADLNPSTINPQNVKVYSHSTGYKNCAVGYDVQSHRIIINPADDFFAGEEVLVTLTSNILSSYGDSLSSFSYKFFTAAQGTGYFNDHVIFTFSDVIGLTSGDYDKDGDIDLLIVRANGFELARNNGNAQFTEDLFFNYNGFVPENAVTEDCDGDGDLDIIFGSHVSQFPIEFIRFSVYKNNGDGSFTFDSEYLSEAQTIFNNYVRTGDAQSDGDMDLMYGIMVRQSPHINYSTILLQYNNGIGGFPDHTKSFYLFTSCPFSYYPPDNSILGIDGNDFDNDGNMDLAASLFFHNTDLGINCFSISIDYLNSSTGHIIMDRTDLTNLSTGNFNNDRYLDIVTSGITYTNAGAGNFVQSVNQISGNTKITNDFDGDGDIDIAGGNTIYVNNGSGVFSSQGNFLFPIDGEKVCAADFDDDGDVDLVSLNTIGSRNSYMIVTLKQNGYGGTCIVNGAGDATTDSDSLLYFSETTGGYWTLMNYDNTNAFLVSTPDNDSVYVNSGSLPGHFVLYYDNNNFFCNKHVYIDNPLPVEIASFISSVNRNEVTLKWTTSSEINNERFDIERTHLNDKWVFVNSVQGRGNYNGESDYEYIDRNLNSGKYKYRLKQIDLNGNFRYYELQNEVEVGTPERFSLSQNYPNPFNPVTTIKYDIAVNCQVVLKIYDVIGREAATIVNKKQDAGYYSVRFNAGNYSSGVYYYVLKAGSFMQTKKMMLIR